VVSLGVCVSQDLFGSLLAKSSVVTNDPEEADLFFVPFPSFLDAYRAHSASDRVAVKFLAWIQAQPYHKRLGGHDHVFVHTFPWDDFIRKAKQNWITLAMDTWYRDHYVLRVSCEVCFPSVFPLCEVSLCFEIFMGGVCVCMCVSGLERERERVCV
jgi:Exostosin family